MQPEALWREYRELIKLVLHCSSPTFANCGIKKVQVFFQFQQLKISNKLQLVSGFANSILNKGANSFNIK